MSERLHLLPSNATPFERAVSESLDRMPEVGPGVADLHTFKLRAPIPDSVLPWLIQEYGLGPVTPYLPNLATAILYGVPWSRLKGTPAGVLAALQWIGYAYDSLYEAPTRRNRWHLFELELDRFWDAEADLAIIEAVGRLSEPARSPFWRGWREYNVRELEWSEGRWGDAMWGDDSGVRLHQGGVKWSFGRTHEPEDGSYNIDAGTLIDLGLWVNPPVDGGGQTWGPFPWTTPGLTWVSSGEVSWQTVIATGLLAKSCWIELYRDDHTVIGARRARAWHPVEVTFDGVYQVGSTRYDVSETSKAALYVEAMTDFGEGDGEHAASWSIVLGATLPDGSKPGVMWLDGDQLVGGVRMGDFALAPGTVLGKTSRERLRGILRIASATVYDDEAAVQAIEGRPNGLAIDFVSGHYALRETSSAETLLGENEGLAIDITDDSYAVRTA